MRSRFQSDQEGWSPEGRKITAPENMEAIRRTLELEGPVIVEHWFYYGANAPERRVFDDFDEFKEYLGTHVFAGDAIHVWSFASLCRNDNELAYGKCPDENGLVPKRGAY